MATTLNIPTSARMIIDLRDLTIARDLKHLLSKIEGVSNVSVKKNYYDSKQFYQDIDKAEADIASGKCVRIDSVESLNALFA